MSRDRFAMVPRSFTDALRMREITADEYALGVFLIDQAQGEGVVASTLLALSEWLGWECDSETVRRRVRALEAEGWIACEVKKGSAAWLIRLTDLLTTSSRLPRHFLAREPSDEEVDLHTDFLAPPIDDTAEAPSDAASQRAETSSPTSSLARARRDETKRYNVDVARTRANGQGREAAARGEEQARGDAEALLLVAQLTGGNDPGPKQLADWMRKHAAAPDGFIVTCRKYLKKAGNQIAQFDAALKRDEHLQTQKEHDRKGNRPEVCDDCGQSNGRHAVDCLVLRGAA